MTKRNITSSENTFYESRAELIEKAPKDFIADAPSVFSSRIGVQSLVTRYELYKKILDVPGDIIELGVYKGNSFSWLAHLSVILEPHAINRRLIGFDTFCGFASINRSADPDDISTNDFSDTNYEIIKQGLANIDIVRPVSKIERFHLVKGDILETLPAFLEENKWMTCAMLILDTDLYEPTKMGLRLVLPMMPKGAIIVFDEYNYQNFPGETQAIKEELEMNKLRVKKMPYESCTAYAIIE
jgi:hypothetical protein